jgi:hypothetical protein
MSTPVSYQPRRDQKRRVIFFVIGLVVFEAFLILGLQTDHFLETLSNGAMICLSCIGVG